MHMRQSIEVKEEMHIHCEWCCLWVNFPLWIHHFLARANRWMWSTQSEISDLCKQ